LRRQLDLALDATPGFFAGGLGPKKKAAWAA
jgi:hypothetical protein